MTTTSEFTLCAARDGGLVLWCSGQSEPVFGGDLKAFGEYMTGRAQELLAAAAKEKKESADHITKPQPLIREVLSRRLELTDAAE